MFLTMFCHVLTAQPPTPIPLEVLTATSFSTSPTLLPPALERHRFSAETFYGLENRYPDLGWIAQNSSSSYRLDEMQYHLFLSRAYERIGSHRFYRSGKGHGFTRVPFCELGIQIDSNYVGIYENPDDYLTTVGGYFNYDLYDSTATCREGTDYGADFLRPIIEASHRRHQTIGLYVKIFSDYFFEIQRSTRHISQIGSQEPLGPDILPSPSLSLCRSLSGYDTQPIYPNGTTLTHYIASDTINELLASTAGGELFIHQDTLILNPWVSPPLLHFWHPTFAYDHYLCLSSPEWRKQNVQRLTTFARNGADYMAFDVVHMPAEGCFCQWCRRRYAQRNPIAGIPFDTLVAHYVGNENPINDGPNLEIHEQHRLFDFMNITQKEAFTEYLQTMHTNHPDGRNEWGTLAVVSVEDLGGLIKDDYRTDFAHLIDIPKTEWFTPIKSANNFVFFSREYPNPVADSPNKYFSILADYYIPEDIRTAGALTTLRDASKYRRTFVWLPYSYRENTTANNFSVRNNQRLRTYLGFGYVLGAMTRTTISPFFRIDNSATDSFRLTQRLLWDFTNITDPLLAVVNDSAALITPIFALDDIMGEQIAGMQAVPYVGLLFSEEERNAQLYLPDSLLVLNAPLLPIPSNANGNASTSTPGLRQSLAWWKHLLPFYGAFAALQNGIPVSGVSYKFPTQVLNDVQLLRNYMNGNKAIIVPVPDKVNDVPPATPFINMLPATQDAIAHTDVPAIPVFRHRNWFNTLATEAQQRVLQKGIRDAIISQVGLPDVYVTGHSAEAHTAQVGFYADTTNTALAIPIVIQPMYGIPRTDEHGVPNTVLDLQTVPADAYDTAPLQVDAGRLVVHIRKGNDMMFSAENTANYTARAYFSDLTLPQTVVNLVITEDTAANEYLIELPAFTCFLMVRIDISE